MRKSIFLLDPLWVSIKFAFSWFILFLLVFVSKSAACSLHFRFSRCVGPSGMVLAAAAVVLGVGAAT